MVSEVFVWPQALEKPHTATVLNCLPCFRKGVRQGGVMGRDGDSAGSSTWFLPILAPQVVSALRNVLKVFWSQ